MVPGTVLEIGEIGEFNQPCRSDLPTNTLEKTSIKWINTNVYQDVQILHSKILGEAMKL
jgi:hypothetical protein